MASTSLLRLILVYVAVRAFRSPGLLDLSRSGKRVRPVKLLRLLMTSLEIKMWFQVVCGIQKEVASKDFWDTLHSVG